MEENCGGDKGSQRAVEPSNEKKMNATGVEKS